MRPHFFPKTFVKENKDISLEQFALEEDQLKELGRLVTKLRKGIQDNAEKEEGKYEEDKEASLKTIQELSMRIQQRGTKSTRKSEELPYQAFKELVPEGSRRKSRRGQPIGANEKVEMVYKVVALKELQKDVARAHRVNASTVSQLVTKAKKNKNFIPELLSAKEDKEDLASRIMKIIEEMSLANIFIDSVAFV